MEGYGNFAASVRQPRNPARLPALPLDSQPSTLDPQILHAFPVPSGPETQSFGKLNMFAALTKLVAVHHIVLHFWKGEKCLEKR
jgi:hypothetical protein